MVTIMEPLENWLKNKKDLFNDYKNTTIVGERDLDSIYFGNGGVHSKISKISVEELDKMISKNAREWEIEL